MVMVRFAQLGAPLANITGGAIPATPGRTGGRRGKNNSQLFMIQDKGKRAEIMKGKSRTLKMFNRPG